MNNAEDQNKAASIKRMVAMYNMIPNLLWSIINFTPIFIFCYHNINTTLGYIFLAISLLTTLLPVSFFTYIQLSTTTSLYKKIGVKFINKFTQNGDLINGLIRKRFPRYNVISTRNISHKKLLRQTYMFEKFHFAMFVFFTLVIVYALIKKYFLWAFIIAISNIVYNVYPNLLQQYIRIRLNLFNKKGNNIIRNSLIKERET